MAECGCTENNCPHKTSDVTVFDGTFTNITVPAGSSLNDVLALLENYATSASQCNDVNYTFNSNSACLGLNAGTYSFSQIIDAIVAKICSNASSIEELNQAIQEVNDAVNTTDVTLDGIVLPTCFSGFSGTTSTALFNTILGNLCTLLSESGPTIGDGDTPVTPDTGVTLDPTVPSMTTKDNNVRLEVLSEGLRSVVDNHSFIYEHTTPVVSPTSFTIPIQVMRGVVGDYLVIRKFTEDLAVSPTMDTYFYLSGDTSILRREVAVAAPAPATPANSHLLYKVTSDGSGVTALTEMFTDNALNPIPLGTDDVKTVNILDGAVTSAKMDTIISSITEGDVSLIRVRIDEKGRVIQLDGNLDVTGITNGQILVYNSSTNAFEKADNTTVATAYYYPVSNAAGTDYTDGSLTESGTQISTVKKVEIHDGAVEDDSEALLNISGTGTFKMPRLTAAEASALVVTNAAMIYVTSTDATFTSVGFWGVEAGVWVKL